MIELKVRKIGNSLGFVLPKEALARLKVAEGETVYMTDSRDGGYRLTALNEKFPEQMKAAEKIMQEDRDILHELAKKNLARYIHHPRFVLSRTDDISSS